MGSTGIKALKPTPTTHPRPLPKGGEESLPQPPPKEGELRACEELVCTLFALPSFGGVGGGLRGLREVSGGLGRLLGRAHDLPVFSQNQNSPYD